MGATTAFRTIGTGRLRKLLLVVVMLGIGSVPDGAQAELVSENPEPSWGVGGCPPRQRDDCPRVWAIAVGNGRVYFGGDFTEAVSPDGATRVPRNALVALDAATGELDTDFLPAPDGRVRSLALSPDGTKLFVGGRFDAIGGASHRNLAALDPFTGAALPEWRADASGAVWALTVGNGRLYAGGQFGSITDNSGSHGRTRLAALDLDTGAVDDRFRASADDLVQSVELSPDHSRLYAGGLFLTLNGRDRESLAAVDALTGDLDGRFAPGSTPRVWAVTVDADRLYAAVGGPGGELRGLDPDTGRQLWRNHQDGDFQAVAVHDDIAYGGGHFSGKLVAVEAATGRQTDFDAGVNSPGGVFRLVTSGRYLYLGGDFTRVSGEVRRHYARLPGPPVPPSAPTGVTAIGGEAAAVVSWVPPAEDGGSPLTGYSVTPYRDGVAAEPRRFASTATTQTVTGLDNGVAYSFRVAAVNRLGTGGESAPSPAVIPRSRPAAPAEVVAEAAATAALVRWVAPSDDGGSPITSYHVTPYRSGRAETPRVVPGTATEFVVAGLLNGTPYTFTVRALNDLGAGPESAPSAAVTPRTRPGTPVGVAAVAAGDEVRLRWTPPTDDGGSPLTGYVVTAYRDGVAQAPWVFPPTVTLPVSVGSGSGRPEAFTVAAVNAAGPGPASSPVAPRSGYWMAAADGAVYAFGNVTNHHRGAAGLPGGAPVADIEPTPTFAGYWLADSAGRVFPSGDARHHGEVTPGRLAPGELVTSLSATPTGAGYWLFTSRGRVFTFGDAVSFGDLSGVALNAPVRDSVVTRSGKGYFMMAADGGVFTFGDAAFAGSLGGMRLNAAVRAMVSDPDGAGYWLVAADGGVFAFDAVFRGSMGATPLNRPIAGMVPYGDGYLMAGEDGGVFNFSGLPFAGSLGGTPPPRPVVALAATAM